MKMNRILALFFALLAVLFGASAQAQIAGPTPTTTKAFISMFGMNTHIDFNSTVYSNNPTAIGNAMSYLGFNQIRQPMTTGYNTTAYNGLAAQGLSLDVDMQNGDSDTVGLINAVNQFLTANPGHIASIEGPNEIANWPVTFNGQTGVAGAVALQQDLYPRVRNNPQTANTPVLMLTLLMQASSSGAGDQSAYATYGNAHIYPQVATGGGITPYTSLQQNVPYQVNTFTPSLATAISEGGYYTSPVNTYGVSTDVQMRYMLDYMFDAAVQGLPKVYFYELFDNACDPNNTNSELHFGVFLCDTTTAKPAATAIHNLTTILADSGNPTAGPSKFTVSGLPNSAMQIGLAKSNGATDIVVWAEPVIWNQNSQTQISAPLNTVTVTLPSTFASVKVYDPTIGTGAQQTLTNVSTVNVTVSDHPIIVEVSNSTSTPAKESTDQTVITTVGPQITDANGNTFAISSGAQILINGTIDTSTKNVVELAYVNHVVWQKNSSGNWYNYLGTPGSYGGPTTTSPLSSGGSGKTSPPVPLTGTVTTQTWVSYDQNFSGVTLTSGKPFHFNVLPPAQYNSTSYKYPLMIWLHPDGSGNAWYTGGNTDPFFYIPNEPSNFNTVSFLTNYPAVVAVPYADQTCGNSAICNWGGWVNNGSTGSGTNFSGDTGPNTYALLSMINFIESNYSIDPNRVYCQGFSLGGIGCEYLLQMYNAYNGNPKVFAAGTSTGGVLEINGYGAGPTSANATTMSNVPVWWFSGANDNTSIPADWNLPMWRLLAGNSNYPSAITSPAVNQAGTSQMHFTLCPTCGHQSTDSAGNLVSTNSTIMNWMFGTSATSTTSPGTGHFHVVNGQIVNPSGQKFTPVGLNIADFRSGLDMANAVTNFTTGAPLTSLFPGINFVRLALYGGGSSSSPTSYPDPTAYDAFINAMTSLGIVVELEHHVENNGATGGGGQGTVPQPGDAWLTAENNNYAALASHFINNAYVWFGTTNEPPEATPDLSIWQKSTYDAIRNTGNQNPILLEVWGSRLSGHGGADFQSGMVQSYYTPMTNTIWDLHMYGFSDDYNTDQTFNNNYVAQSITAAQTITSGDGTMPVIIAEFGPSTTGSSLDANGTQNVTAVLQSGVGNAVWHWGQQDCCNNTNNGNTLTALGQQVANAIAQNASQTPSEGLSINTVQNVAANVAFTVSGSITNASGTPVLQYQNNSGGWQALPSGAQVTSVGFSFTDPGMTSPGTANNTVSVRDANNTSIVATSNTFTVTGSESANNTTVSAALTTPTFSDNFSSLSLHRTWQSGDKWQLIAPDTTDGRGGPNFGENGDQWWVNPYNPSTPISGVYNQDTSGLHLALINTPSAQQSYINNQAGATLPYVGGLLNTSQTNYQKYGYWEITVAVPKVNGFTFQADTENVQITGTFPPEIDLRIGTNSSGVQTVLFEIATDSSNYTKFTMPTTFDPTQSHTYGWDWESDFITFYVDGTQVYQTANPSSAYQTNPMFLFILTAANYVDNTGDPAAASLPVTANLTSVNIYATKPAAITAGSIIDASGEVWTITASGQVAVNGTPDTTTSNVVELAYVNHAVWYETNGGVWQYKTKASDTWQPPGGTTTSPLNITESPNNTTVTTVGPQIIDSHGSTFAINSSGQVVINGTADTATKNVVELAYVNHVVWQENSAGNWYNYLGTPGSYGGPTTASPLTTESISINSIAAQTANTPFNVTGSVSNVSAAPTLQYQDNSGSWTAFPSGSSVTLGSGNTATFTLAHPGMSVGQTNTINIRDANNTSIAASSNGFAVNAAGETISVNAVPTPTAGSAFTITGTISGISTGSGASTNFAYNPGQDGSFWKQPFQSSANWITSGSLINALRGGSPTINLKGNYGVPWVIGTANDPVVQVTDGTKTINVHMPLGTIIETPTSAFDQSIGGTDATQPYLLWSISGATMNTGSVQSSGSVITGTYGFAIQDGAGLVMVDAVTGAPGDNNSIGGIQDYDLQQITSDPNYVIPHMLAFQMDSNNQASTGLVWPLKLTDTSNGSYAGPIPQGITIGIPANVQMPSGKTRAFKALWDQLQRFGMFNYNFGATGGVNFVIYDQSGNYSSLISDLESAWTEIGQNYIAILNYNSGVSGAQYSLATTKGAVPGSTNAFPAPPPLDLSPTGGKNVAPSTFGAWYPNTDYTATPTNPGVTAAGTPPTLQYQDGSGSWLPLPSGSTVTTTSFTFLHPSLGVGSYTVNVRDANNTSVIGTASFSVVAASGGSTAWNPSDTSTSITLSNNNTTAQSSSAVRGGTRSMSSQSTGKYCFENTVNTMTANLAVGLSNTAYSPSRTVAQGADANSVGFNPALPGSFQSMLYNGTQILRPVISELTPTSGGTLYDNAGNAWTLQSDTNMYINGNVIPSSHGTGAMTIVNNIVYAQDAASLAWYTYAPATTTGTFTPSSAPTLPVASTADVSGDAITECVDLSAQKIWVSTPAMRSASGIVWNSDVIANQNPATGTGGKSFSGLNCPCFITATTTNVSTSVNINTAGPFALALPSGFQVWQSAPVIIHHPYLFNFGQNTPANDNALYLPARFERAAR